MKAREYGKATLAKIAAETLKVAQDGERKANELDLPAEPQPGGQATVRVVIERASS